MVVGLCGIESDMTGSGYKAALAVSHPRQLQVSLVPSLLHEDHSIQP